MKYIAMVGLVAAVLGVGLCRCDVGVPQQGISEDAVGQGGQDGGMVEGVWVDSSSGLMWQNPIAEKQFAYNDAISYCNDLSLAGYNDWRVPTINELRSLIRGCPDTQTGGACGVTDSCLEDSCGIPSCLSCWRGGPREISCYWDATLIGACDYYWSSSPVATDPTYIWVIGFYYGDVNATPKSGDKSSTLPVRCVREP